MNTWTVLLTSSTSKEVGHRLCIFQLLCRSACRSVSLVILAGKWLLHLPRKAVDAAWERLACTLLGGSLGPQTYMVKVSPVEDVNLSLAGGSHVLIVYNEDYR